MALAALGRDFERLCAEALTAAGAAGGAFGVLHGEGEARLAVGVLERGAERPVTPESTFRVASVTKPFTATLALRLAGSGALDLETVLPGPEPAVTVRHVLAHLGGFESECGDLARFGEGDDALPRLAAELRHQRRLVPPGRLWSYCNAGYWLLGHLLAERTGSSYERALEEQVLRPLGLRATHFGEPDAAGHDPEPQRPPYPRARRASGGLVSNVRDLLAFARLHLEAPEAPALREPVVATPGGHQGYGLMLERVGGLELWGHVGSWGGYESRFCFEPERGFAFAGLANAAGAGPVLRDLQDAAVERVLGVRREPAATIPLPDTELALLAGRYAGAESDVTFAAQDGGLTVDATQVAADGARRRLPVAHARSLGGRLFELGEGEQRGSRFDFHAFPGDAEDGTPRFVRFSSRLAERVAGA